MPLSRRPIFWQTFPWLLVVALLTGALIVAFASATARTQQRTEAVSALRGRAVLVQERVSELLADSTELGRVLERYGRLTSTRFTVVGITGQVIADSDSDPSTMDNHSDRPEIISAFRGDTGDAARYSSTIGRTLMYVAIPLVDKDTVRAVLRTSLSMKSALGAAGIYTWHLVFAALAVVLAAAMLSWAVSRRIARPIEDLTRGSERFARGDFSEGLAIPSTAETARLATALNAMAEQLDERIRAIVRKGNEQDAILSAMVEGVIAVDTEERVLGVNETARRMLKLSGDIGGRFVQETIRNPALQRLINDLLRTRAPLEREIPVNGPDGELALEAHGAVLHGSRGGVNGVLVVMHDITRLRRLENVRREFVANVSHELRTPLTNIKGYVETLRDGAGSDSAERERFLGIILHHVDRLNTLIEDLLTISRLEREEATGSVELVEQTLDGVVKSAAEVCGKRAEVRRMKISLENGHGVRARVSATLLEQAVVNLVDNAVKYGTEGTTVHVSVTQTDSQALITVRDEGPGIAAEHLPRLFERFYRIDKARSSKLGGTGLGLAIVKHIMIVHGGTVTVESTPGNGSTFTLHLPAPAASC